MLRRESGDMWEQYQDPEKKKKKNDPTLWCYIIGGSLLGGYLFRNWSFNNASKKYFGDNDATFFWRHSIGFKVENLGTELGM